MTNFNVLLSHSLPNEARYGFFEVVTNELADAGGKVKAECLHVTFKSYSQSPILNFQFSIPNS
jgi:hypothetical protein